MKLANFENPLKMNIVREYAFNNNFAIMEFAGKVSDNFSIVKMILLCIEKAKQNNSVEFCIKEIRYKYNINEDSHDWYISILGFIPIN